MHKQRNRRVAACVYGSQWSAIYTEDSTSLLELLCR